MRLGPVEIVVLLALLAAVVLLAARNRRSRPVADELAELFDDPPAQQPGPRALGWAYGALFEAGVEADGDRAYAVKVLRDADPRLSGAAAAALVDRMRA